MDIGSSGRSGWSSRAARASTAGQLPLSTPIATLLGQRERKTGVVGNNHYHRRGLCGTSFRRWSRGGDMTDGFSSPFAATGSLLGYLYQVRYALLERRSERIR